MTTVDGGSNPDVRYFGRKLDCGEFGTCEVVEEEIKAARVIPIYERVPGVPWMLSMGGPQIGQHVIFNNESRTLVLSSPVVGWVKWQMGAQSTILPWWRDEPPTIHQRIELGDIGLAVVDEVHETRQRGNRLEIKVRLFFGGHPLA